MCLLFVFAVIIRLINLNQSLWLDEATVAKVIRTIPFLQIPLRFSPGDFHPPLYYMFMSLWSGIFGHSEIALRMPSVLFSLIAGWCVFRIGLSLKDKKTGLWAAAFFLFNPLVVYYSQEARMYMMATMFLSATLYYFLKVSFRAKRSNLQGINASVPWPRNDIVLFNLFSALAMFTFYGSAFFIGTMILVGCVVIPANAGLLPNGRIQRKITQLKIVDWIPIFMGMTWGWLVSLLLLFPLLLQQLHNAKIGLSEVKNWSLVLGKAEMKNFAMIFVKFATGRISWYPKWSYYVTAGIFTAITWVVVFFGIRKNKLLTFLFFFPLIIGYIISFITPMMMYFRFLYLIPVMSLLLALGVIPRKVGIQRTWISIGITIIFLIFSFAYLFNPQFHREDWKKMVQDIDSRQPVYMILPSSDPVSYYNPSLSLLEMRNMDRLMLPEHIQVIPYVEEIYGYNHTTILEKKGCIKEMQSEYRGPLILERWNCPPLFIGQKSESAI